jgi:HK97 family phage portal protein
VGFWSWLKNADPSGITANANPSSSVGAPAWQPGDPDGVVMDRSETFSRSLPVLSPSPWSGWPAGWDVPGWGDDTGGRLGKLVDTAWACLDLNSSVLSTMPAYQTRSGRIMQPESWMTNPDPLIYNSWEEFAKQLFWDYQLGEAFVLPYGKSGGYPSSFRVIPPPFVKVEMDSGGRKYMLGNMDITDEVLHIRYKSTTTSPHGVGPLESAGARMTTAGVLSRYVSDMVASGGTPHYALVMDAKITEAEADRMLQRWIDSRSKNLGQPAVLGGGVSIATYQRSAKEMALLELSQWNESRIAIALGVPPFLVGLPSGGDSMTYSNVSSLFDFHDRSSLRPKAGAVMSAFSNWAVPRGRAIELNRDEYTRPDFAARADAEVKLVQANILSGEEVRAMERFNGPGPAIALTGGDLTSADMPAQQTAADMSATPSRGGQP